MVKFHGSDVPISELVEGGSISSLGLERRAFLKLRDVLVVVVGVPMVGKGFLSLFGVGSAS